MFKRNITEVMEEEYAQALYDSAIAEYAEDPITYTLEEVIEELEL